MKFKQKQKLKIPKKKIICLLRLFLKIKRALDPNLLKCSVDDLDLSIMIEALPGVLGNRGNRAFISGEHGNKGQILRGTGEQRQYWGTGNIRKQFFNFCGIEEQANLFQGNKGTGTPPPWEGLMIYQIIR